MDSVAKIHNEQLAALDKAAAEAKTQFEAAVGSVLGARFHATFNRKDRLRVLNLITWSDRHKLPLTTVVSVLVDHWRGKFPVKNALEGRLGVRMSTFAGKRSREILEEWVVKRFPSHENVTAWKSKMQSTAVVSGMDRTPITSNPFMFTAEYKHQIKDMRSKCDGLKAKFQRRKFRDNPWI